MNDPAMFLNGAAQSVDEAQGVPLFDSEPRAGKRAGWFTRVVVYYLRRNKLRAAQPLTKIADGPSETVLARAAIRSACIKSAFSGAAAGMVSTGATVFTAETEGIGGLIAGPIAALVVGGEMIYRATLHVELSCQLASIFGVQFDPDDDNDIWRLYALAFGTHGHEEGSTDPGKELVSEVTHLEGEQVGEKIGHRVLGESVMRNIVPVLGIFFSAYTNYRVTRDLGDTVRRYMRYQRAMDDAGSEALAACCDHLDLLIEGIWFIFSADGKLTPEETAFLAHMLRKLSPVRRHAVLARFVEDETDWTKRLKVEVPDRLRDVFMRTLEVAAAVDKEVGLPERKILRRAARALDREFSAERIEKMIASFEEHGVLGHGQSDGANGHAS